MGKGTVCTAEATMRPDAASPAAQASLSLLLKRAEHVLRDRMYPVLAVEDLLFEHWQIMAVLHSQPGLRMSDIAHAALLPPATLTRHMDRLVERALVIRRIDPDDKRSAIAALSSRGERLAARLQAIEDETATELLDDLVRIGPPRAVC